MADKRVKNNIDIERNIIEQYLMLFKDFVKNNNKFVKTAAIAVLVIIVISVSLFVYIESSLSASFKKYESIVDTYRMNPSDRAVKDKTMTDLQGLIKDTSFGHAHQMSFYILGNLLFEDAKYDEAYNMFSAFIKKSSSDEIFVPIAVNKASVCLEEMGKTDDAINLLLKFEEDNRDAVVMDQILYNMGRLYAIKGDKVKAREYFGKVLAGYPDSVFSERARERMFLQSAEK